MDFSSETKLSKHFKLKEFEKSQMAYRLRIDNRVTDKTIFNNLIPGSLDLIKFLKRMVIKKLLET